MFIAFGLSNPCPCPCNKVKSFGQFMAVPSRNLISLITYDMARLVTGNHFTTSVPCEIMSIGSVKR